MIAKQRFLQAKLKLKGNDKKSAVARPWQPTLLGFSFTTNRDPRTADRTEGNRELPGAGSGAYKVPRCPTSTTLPKLHCSVGLNPPNRRIPDPYLRWCHRESWRQPISPSAGPPGSWPQSTTPPPIAPAPTFQAPASATPSTPPAHAPWLLPRDTHAPTHPCK